MRRPVEALHEKTATMLLLGLLLGDLAFLALHVVHSLTPYFASPMFNIELDKGYAERYQYLKYLGLILTFAWLCAKKRTSLFLPWALLFAYFLADDGWQMHERLGTWIGEGISYTPPFRLRKEDLGELTVTATAGLVLLPSFLAAYYFAPRMVRKTFHDLLLLLGLLMVFAVGIDMVHAAFIGSPRIEFVLGVIEDGGEMIAVSLIAWYACFVAGRLSGRETYLLNLFIPSRTVTSPVPTRHTR
jgi:hypothetical protein